MADDSGFTTNVLTISGTLSASNIPVVSQGSTIRPNLIIPIVNGSTPYFACRYIKLIITDTSNSEGYIEAGRLFVGTTGRFLNPTYNLSYGYGLEVLNDAEVMRSKNGVDYFGTAVIRRQFTIQLDELSAAERASLLYMYAYGPSDEWLVMLNPSETEHMQHVGFLGRVKRPNSIFGNKGNVFSNQIVIEEIV